MIRKGFKYSLDENLLRSRLLEQVKSGLDGAWEKFESYMDQQKGSRSKTEKIHFRVSVHPGFLLRILIALFILSLSLFFYGKLNSGSPPFKSSAKQTPQNPAQLKQN
ncbi:MAG TPA: hypothetical protein PLQ93_05610 [Bacteroidia bacterium]|nr:hypothetical protein [Bacteroidia bacterium]